MAPQNRNLRVLAAKAETTAGTYNAPANADFDVRCYNIELSPSIEFDDDTTRYATGDHGEDVAVSGNRVGTVSFSIKLAPGASATTEPNSWKFLKACGLEAITYAGTGVALVRRKSADKSTISICVTDQTIGASPVYTQYKLRGCIGNAVISSEGIGKPWVVNFTFNAVISDIIDGTGLVITAPDSTNPEKLLNSDVSIHGESVQIGTFSFDLGNTISAVGDQSTADGVSHYYISSSSPRLSIDPLAKNQADWDLYDSVVSDSVGAASIAGSNYTLKVLRGQIMNPSHGDRESLVTWDLTMRALRNGFGSSLADSDLEAEDTFELLHGARA